MGWTQRNRARDAHVLIYSDMYGLPHSRTRIHRNLKGYKRYCISKQLKRAQLKIPPGKFVGWAKLFGGLLTNNIRLS